MNPKYGVQFEKPVITAGSTLVMPGEIVGPFSYEEITVLLNEAKARDLSPTVVDWTDEMEQKAMAADWKEHYVL